MGALVSVVRDVDGSGVEVLSGMLCSLGSDAGGWEGGSLGCV